jgi:hypothetical protein
MAGSVNLTWLLMYANRRSLARLIERLLLHNNALTGTVPLKELSRLENLGKDSGNFIVNNRFPSSASNLSIFPTIFLRGVKTWQ